MTSTRAFWLFPLSVIVANGLLLWITPSRFGEPGSPPGWVVGLVWVALFGLFGMALRQVTRDAPADRAGQRGILLLAIACLAYPLYTGGLAYPLIGIVGNIATGAIALVVMLRLARGSPIAAALVAPILPWLMFASWVIVRDLGLLEGL